MVELLPLSWRLQFRVALMELRVSSADEEWLHIKQLGPNRGTVLDIGANRGLYALRLASLYERVIAFEPNQTITRELVALRHPRIHLEPRALSSTAGTATLFVPLGKSGEILDGWGSFDCENLAEHFGQKKICTEVTTLDELQLEGVTFVKLDVEGHEIDVLRGGLDFLANQQPVLLVEIRRKHLSEARLLLRSVGLVSQDISRCIGKPASNEMHLFTVGLMRNHQS